MLLGVFISVNPTLLHAYYRDQLSELWIVPDAEYGPSLPLRCLKNCEHGAPFRLLHGTVPLIGSRRDQDKDRLVRFTMSKTHVGAERTGYAKTDEYMGGRFCLADAMAISGAALSPVAIDNVLIRTLLVLMNFRLGQWLPHPTRSPGDLTWPSPLKLAASRTFTDAEDRSYLFVSDGGHIENTGISALLQRRCRVIIACDASQDGESSCADFCRLMLESRSKYGVRFLDPVREKDIDVSDILPKAKEKDGDGTVRTKEHYVLIRIQYPDDELSKHATLGENRTGWLIYIKSTLNGDEPVEMLLHQKTQPQFPHDETLDQFFEPKRFMLYRQLGEHMGDDVCKRLFSSVEPDPKTRSEKTRSTWLANEWQQGRGFDSKTDHGNPEAPAALPLVAIDGALTSDRLTLIVEHLASGTSDQCQLDCVYLREYGKSGNLEGREQLVTAIRQRLSHETDCSTRIELCEALSLVGDFGLDARQILGELKASDPEDLVRKTCELLLHAMK